MNGPYGTARSFVALAIFALALPAAASAQEGGPLLKSDLVRMMTASNYTATEMAAIVRMNCVGFEPTARDRNQLGNLPNADLVLAEVDRCRSRPASSRLSEKSATVAQAPAAETFKAPPRPARRRIDLDGLDIASSSSLAPELERPEGPSRLGAQIERMAAAAEETETPPALLNWKEVSDAFLREYRPNVRQPGTVLLWLRVGPDGKVTESRVKKSSGDPVMADAALRITRVMEFRPATRRDKPVETWTQLPISYSAK